MMDIAKYFCHAKYAFRTFVLRQQAPYLFGMVITDRCNLNCFYCGSKNAGKCHFTKSSAIEALKNAYLRGHRTLYFTGGEPMIWKDEGWELKDLVKYAREIGFNDVFIFTNGTMPLSIDFCSYIVSIDGPRDVHNEIRDNSYDLIIDNVRNSVGKSVFASITVNKANVSHLGRFVVEIGALGIFKGISFNLLTHWPEFIEKHGLSREEKIKFLDEIWSYKKRGAPIVLSKAAYVALRENSWERPIPQIELATNEKVYTCCRDIENPSICENCGYSHCVEVSQILSLKPSAIYQVFKMTLNS